MKQPAWAAATSSSGLVPLPSPKRALNEYGTSLSVPLCTESVPLPSWVVPCQRADALRCMMGFLRLREWHFNPSGGSWAHTLARARGCANIARRPAVLPPPAPPPMTKPKTTHFDTLSLHAGARPDPATGARATPIYQSASFVFPDSDHARGALQHGAGGARLFAHLQSDLRGAGGAHRRARRRRRRDRHRERAGGAASRDRHA